MQSPGFSSFRELIDIWQEYQMIEASKDNIRLLLDGQGLILFFKKDNDIYGAPEESRVVFAKLKKPDEDTNKAWVKDASFVAMNLTKAAKGERVQSVFNKKDLKHIHVMDKEDVIEKLGKEDSKDDINMIVKAKKEPANMIPMHGEK